RILPPPGVGEVPATVPNANPPAPEPAHPGPPQQVMPTAAGKDQPAEAEMLPAPRPVPGSSAPPGQQPTPAGESPPAVANREYSQMLTLDEAIALAFRLQPRLRIFWEQIQQAEGRSQAAFAPFLPQVTSLTQGFSGRNPNGPIDGISLPLPGYPTSR